MHLWDGRLELETNIRSSTVHEIYKLEREVTKTVMSAKTSDISQLYKLEWFAWIMFQDETAPFQDDVLKLGHCLGPSIDVGPAMTAKIPTENGQVIHWSTYMPLFPEELLDKTGQMPEKCSWLESMKGWGP